MGRAARAAVEAWDWRYRQPRYAEMFEAVLAGRRGEPADLRLVRRLARKLFRLKPCQLRIEARGIRALMTQAR